MGGASSMAQLQLHPSSPTWHNLALGWHLSIRDSSLSRKPPQPSFEFISFDSRVSLDSPLAFFGSSGVPGLLLSTKTSWCLRLHSAKADQVPVSSRPLPRWDFLQDKQSTVFWLKLCTQQTISENFSQEKFGTESRTDQTFLRMLPYGDAMRSFWVSFFKIRAWCTTFDANELTTWQQDNAEWPWWMQLEPLEKKPWETVQDWAKRPAESKSWNWTVTML